MVVIVGYAVFYFLLIAMPQRFDNSAEKKEGTQFN
jgi:hypothetical protein